MKKILMISKSYDVLSKDIDLLLDIFNQGYWFIKKKTDKAFKKIELDRFGVLWFSSYDFTNFCSRFNEIKPILDKYGKYTFEVKYAASEKSIDWLVNQLEMLQNTIGKDNFSKRFYVRVEFDSYDRNTIKQVIDVISIYNPYKLMLKIYNCIDRLLGLQIVSEYKFLQSYSRRYKFNTYFCSCNNRFLDTLDNKPCVDTEFKEFITGEKYSNIDLLYKLNEHCKCKVYDDLFGCGEVFNPEKHREKKKELKKLE